MNKVLLSATFFVMFNAVYASCPAPFKKDDLFCHLLAISKLSEESDSGEYDPSDYNNAPVQAPTKLQESYVGDKGIINRVTTGPNQILEDQKCAFRKISASFQEKQENNRQEQIAENKRIKKERQEWYAFSRNDIRTTRTGDLSETAQRENQAKAPGNSSKVNVALKDGDPKKDGFYRYNDSDNYVFGTEKTIWQLEEAGKKLAAAGLNMGIGDISRKGGGKLPPHQTHRQGKDVDLRFLNSNGDAKRCVYTDTSCYSRDKTREMLETLINVDPSNVKTVYVNDPKLRAEMRKNFPGVYFSNCKGHDNHLHVKFKE